MSLSKTVDVHMNRLYTEILQCDHSYVLVPLISIKLKAIFNNWLTLSFDLRSYNKSLTLLKPMLVTIMTNSIHIRNHLEKEIRNISIYLLQSDKLEKTLYDFIYLIGIPNRIFIIIRMHNFWAFQVSSGKNIDVSQILD